MTSPALPQIPDSVTAASARAEAAGFTESSVYGVGLLLARMANRVRPNGRILELGTGAGVGTAWLIYGLRGRPDVEIVTVEADPAIAALAAEGDWPTYVSPLVGDAIGLLPELGTFDAIFADSRGGTWEGLEHTIDALNPKGTLIMDDMNPPDGLSEEETREYEAAMDAVRGFIGAHDDLTMVEIDKFGGVLTVQRRLRRSDEWYDPTGEVAAAAAKSAQAQE